MKRNFLVVFSAAVVQLAAGPVTFSDGDFNLANYSAAVTYNPNGITVTNSQILTGGNPNAAIQTILSFTSDFNFAEALIRPTFSYTPSVQGAIATIDTSIDRYLDSNGQATGSSLGGSWVLLQNGNYYRLTSPGTPLSSTPSYVTHSVTGSVATDWNLFDFTTGATNTSLHPNFSSSGSQMEFGYTFRLGSVPGIFPGRWDLRGDNLIYTINTVPEPNTFLLTGVGVLLAWATKRLVWQRA